MISDKLLQLDRAPHADPAELRLPADGAACLQLLEEPEAVVTSSSRPSPLIVLLAFRFYTDQLCGINLVTGPGRDAQVVFADIVRFFEGIWLCGENSFVHLKEPAEQ